MRDGIRRIAGRLLMLVALCLLGGLLSASLVRFAPGYGVDERELDPRLTQASVEAIRNSHRLKSSFLSYYGQYLARALHGDFGSSEWLEQPISSLIKERFPVTARSVVLGVSLAWAMALAVSMAGLFFRGPLFDISGTVVSSMLIALPAAVIAIFSVYLRAPVFLAIAVATFPKLFRYLRNLLAHAYAQPYVLAAHARGLGHARILFHHVLPLASPALFALFGVSLGMAFGAAIPIEALCDSPGVGQLAWQAALNRDLPLIMNLTLLITLVTVAANLLANVAHERAR
ncbi:MAG TPA: ABC transporter permease [Candidatus Dormibacteraeota bacterium]|nr:ABC transporter permease [Candidatus Dormibacteraeota bacterium]